MSETITFKKYHEGQTRIFKDMPRFSVVRAGRRFGKTTGLEQKAAHRAVRGQKVGYFAPTYKLITPTYRSILSIVRPLVDTASKIDGLITLETGGQVEFWTLENEDAGRSRSYDLVIIDEASLKKRGLREIWEQAIKPTLLDRGGSAIMAGTPKGIDDENYFYVACSNKEEGWKEYHAPTWDNPNLDAESVSRLKEENAPLVWQQEYAAEFVDWSGAAFFSLDSMLVDGKPAQPTMYPDYVFAVIDTATKTGREHDGTAVVYVSASKYAGHRMCVLDWDYVQIEGHLLERWLPQVYERLDQFAHELKARHGNIGTFIEDKNSGTILIGQAKTRGLACEPIDSVLTSVGKDERAISVSGYYHQGLVKISETAYNKTVNFKGLERNHLLSQFCGYRVGQKDEQDDLVDCMTYGAAIALGDQDGF